MASGKKNWVRLLVSVGLLALLLWFMVDLDQLLTVVGRADWPYLAAMILALAVDRVLMAYKWRLLLTCRGLPLGLGQAVGSYFLASFAGCFLPSTVGADALRIAAVARPDLPSADLTASVIMERAMGFVAAALAALLGLVLLAGLVADLPAQFFYWSAGVLGVSVLAVAASLSGLAGRASLAVERKLAGRGRLGGWAARILEAYRQYAGHRATLAWFFLLTVIEQGAIIASNWLAAMAFAIDLSLLEAAAVTPVAILLARLPISVSSFGIMEGLYMAFFGLVGVGATEAFLLGLSQNLATLIISLPGLVIYLTAAGGVRRIGRGR